jgi:hypothetical protein
MSPDKKLGGLLYYDGWRRRASTLAAKYFFGAGSTA